MVKYLDFKGEKLPVRISYLAIQKIQEEAGEGIEELMSGGNIKAYETILYWGLVSGFKAEDKECPFDKEGVVEILEETFWEVTKLIPEFFPKEEGQESRPQNQSDFKKQIKRLKKAKK